MSGINAERALFLLLKWQTEGKIQSPLALIDDLTRMLDLVDDDAPEVARPTFNHSRSDGPFDPCPECLARMTRSELCELVRDLRKGKS